MKRILFFFCLTVLPFTASFAQTATTSATMHEKGVFAAHARELDNYLIHNNPTAANSLFVNMKTAMVDHLNNRKIGLRDVPAADQASEKAKYDTEQRLFLEINDLANDLPTNRAIIHTKLTEYYNNY